MIAVNLNRPFAYTLPKYTSKQVSFKGNRFPEVEKLVQQARQLGVKINYGDNHSIALKIGGYVNDALAKAKSKGYRLPQNIFVEKFYNDKDLGECRDWAIYLNKNHNWSDIEGNTRLFNKMNFWSSDKPEHFINHELGHFLHRFESWRAFLVFTKNTLMGAFEFSPAQQALVKANVSKRASLHGTEFVPEFFAGHMAGKKYNKEILALYKKIGGPELR